MTDFEGAPAELVEVGEGLDDDEVAWIEDIEERAVIVEEGPVQMGAAEVEQTPKATHKYPGLASLSDCQRF